jgi:hypothetical protein
MVFAEVTGPEGERLAEQAASEVGAAVGFDPEGGATFDSDDHADEAELKTALAGALDEADPDWASHLGLDAG